MSWADMEYEYNNSLEEIGRVRAALDAHTAISSAGFIVSKEDCLDDGTLDGAQRVTWSSWDNDEVDLVITALKKAGLYEGLVDEEE